MGNVVSSLGGFRMNREHGTRGQPLCQQGFVFVSQGPVQRGTSRGGVGRILRDNQTRNRPRRASRSMALRKRGRCRNVARPEDHSIGRGDRCGICRLDRGSTRGFSSKPRSGPDSEGLRAFEQRETREDLDSWTDPPNNTSLPRITPSAQNKALARVDTTPVRRVKGVLSPPTVSNGPAPTRLLRFP